VIPALLRAEWRKARSTRLWWALLVPVVVVSALLNLVSGVFTLALGTAGGTGRPLLAASLASTLGVTAVVAALHGAVAAAGELRHRTITTTYLTSPRRGPVLLAQALACAAVGTGYALVAVLVGVLASLLSRGTDRFPPPDALLGLTGTGAAVAALAGAAGAAVGALVGSQVGAVLGLLGWALVAEPLATALLATAPALAGVPAHLPATAAATALRAVPAQVLGAPPGALSGPAALVVLAAWTLAVLAVAGWTAARRDIT
jgi:hypothetical protein